MIWYVALFVFSAYWLFTGTYLFLWGLLTWLRHLFFGVPGGYEE